MIRYVTLFYTIFMLFSNSVYSGKVVKYSVFIIKNCNTIASDVQTLKQKWKNLESYLSECSYNKSSLVIDTFKIIDINGCSGCNEDKWAYIADKFKNNNQTGKIIVAPPSARCTWAGASVQWCWNNNCNVWINDINSIDTVLHEIGHNMGLFHSGDNNGNKNIGDGSCIMGNYFGIRCFNAPQSFALNWSKPIADIGKPIVGTFLYNIPTLTSNPINFIRLRQSSTGSSGPLYISFRTRYGFDYQLPLIYVNKISIHMYSGGYAAEGGGQVPLLLGLLDIGNTWNTPRANITFVSISNNFAKINIKIW